MKTKFFTAIILAIFGLISIGFTSCQPNDDIDDGTKEKKVYKSINGLNINGDTKLIYGSHDKNGGSTRSFSTRSYGISSFNQVTRSNKEIPLNYIGSNSETYPINNIFYMENMNDNYLFVVSSAKLDEPILFIENDDNDPNTQPTDGTGNIEPMESGIYIHLINKNDGSIIPLYKGANLDYEPGMEICYDDNNTIYMKDNNKLFSIDDKLSYDIITDRATDFVSTKNGLVYYYDFGFKEKFYSKKLGTYDIPQFLEEEMAYFAVFLSGDGTKYYLYCNFAHSGEMAIYEITNENPDGRITKKKVYSDPTNKSRLSFYKNHVIYNSLRKSYVINGDNGDNAYEFSEVDFTLKPLTKEQAIVLIKCFNDISYKTCSSNGIYYSIRNGSLSMTNLSTYEEKIQSSTELKGFSFYNIIASDENSPTIRFIGISENDGVYKVGTIGFDTPINYEKVVPISDYSSIDLIMTEFK